MISHDKLNEIVQGGGPFAQPISSAAERFDFNSFKDSVLLNNATKGDLQATEKRIMAAIEKVGPYRGDRH